jgi:hypothetical protein
MAEETRYIAISEVLRRREAYINSEQFIGSSPAAPGQIPEFDFESESCLSSGMRCTLRRR